MADKRAAQLIGQAHLVRGDETQLLVKSAAGIRSMKCETVEAGVARPVDDALHEQSGNAAPAPFRFGEDIQDRAQTASRDANRSAAALERMKHCVAQINPGTGDDGFGRCREVASEPT